MKKLFSTILIVALALAVLTGCQKAKTTSANGSAGAANTADNPNLSEYCKGLLESPYSEGKHHVTITMADGGVIELELDADTAPLSTANFCTLAAKGFYDGLTFHRIMEGFMIQGGDPTGTGFGGSSDTIIGEFDTNGVPNPISHVRGVISMARASADSASSQFFIVHQDSDFLDGNYAAFGMVTSGMEVVDQIAENAIVEDNNGTVLAENQPVIESVTVQD